MQPDPSPLELQVADVLRRARRLPIGVHRKDLHQLAAGLLLLRRRGMDALLEDRQAAMRFAFRNAGVDSVTVGYKNTAEIDEAIDNLNRALV